jgi:DNA end-binding protein Ku
MEDADFEGLPVPGVKEIEVLEFVPNEQVDPILFDRSYYLEPESRALKPYVLLREALAQTDRTAIVRVVLRTKTQLGALRVRDEVMVLQTLLWPDEVRAADFEVLNGDADIRPQELTMAASFVDSLSADFDPSQFRDDYREALLAVIDSKLAGGKGVTPNTDVASTEGDGIVLDLMTALRESVRRTQEARGAVSEAEAPPAGSTRKTRTPAAKTSSTAQENEPSKPRAAKQPAKKVAKSSSTQEETATTARKSAKRSA